MSAPTLTPAAPAAADRRDEMDERDQSDRADSSAICHLPSIICHPGDRLDGCAICHLPFAIGPQAAALVAACRAMLELTGGSQYWTGETHDALALMETALKGVRP